MRFTDSLFFAVFPTEAAAARIAALDERLRLQHQLKTKPIPADRLHITLQYLGAFEGVPADIVEKARRAAARISLPEVDITLDRIESFAGRRVKRPLVLSGDASEPLATLERTLHEALIENGIETKRHARFTPHVTLLYDEQRIGRHATEPIAWRAHEFALMRSYLGQSRHERLESWRLHA
jgi:RNA 2',3'-cyclic 3'-phosphodiesterase